MNKMTHPTYDITILMLLFQIFQRIELQKFAKLMRQRRPNSKLSMQYDKLIIDHEIYMFNDITGRVEEVRFKYIPYFVYSFCGN